MRSPTTSMRRSGLTALFILVAAFALLGSTAAKAPAAPATHKWKMTKVTLDGWSQHLDVFEEDHFEAKGRVKYRSKKPLQGKPFRLARVSAPLAVPATVGGINWQASTEAKLSTATGSWNCSYAPTAGRVGLTGLFVIRRKQSRVQWSLAPTFMRCPSEAPKWSFPGLPLAAMTSTFPTRLLKGRKARIPVDIQHRWSDDAGNHEVHWDGSVVLTRQSAR